MTVIDRDLGYDEMRELLTRLAGVKSMTVLVGVRAHHGKKLARIAAINEFGAPNKRIPERSFLRATVDQNQARYIGLIEKTVDRLLDGETPDRSLGLIGMVVVGDVQRRIRGRINPPNAPYTIAKKKSDVPLIDTGRLRQSIDYVVEVK